MNTLHPTVRVKKLRDDAVIPVKAHPTDAAYDLCVREDMTLAPNEFRMAGTGLAFAIPERWRGMIYPRSGLGCKGLVLRNTVGVIDSSYRGEVMLTLWNTSADPIQLHAGDRVAQMCIELVPDSTLVEVDELDETERGTGGFGSSGISGGPRI